MLKVKIKDIEFSSPIIAASGTFGYGDEVSKLVDLSKIGCVITKSITYENRDGNDHPRIHESSSGMLNSIGLANVGVVNFCKEKLPKLNNIKTKFIISIAGSTFEEYQSVLKTIESANGEHVGYEINVSCPNVKAGGMEFGINHDMIFDLVSELRKLTNKLLIVKLSPNVTDIEKIAASSERAGADAISAINTLQGLAIDSKSGNFLLSTKFGGLSGPAIKPVALAKVFKVYNNVKIPIIGMGGISSVSDIVEFLRVGSAMVQIGTVNYRDPSLISKLYDQMLNFMKENNINKITDLTGNYK